MQGGVASQDSLPGAGNGRSGNGKWAPYELLIAARLGVMAVATSRRKGNLPRSCFPAGLDRRDYWWKQSTGCV